MTNTSSRISWLVISGMILALGLILYFMGQPVICECGYVKFWHGDPVSNQNSQHLTDWYTLSHIIHGVLFFWVINWLAPDWPVGLKLLVAVIPEVAWEIIENTDMVIEYYRQNTVSVEYAGDSVVNSVMDVVSMVVGFGLALWLPWPVVLVALLLMEGAALIFIRDNLLLNIIMFVYPFDFISEWQSAAG